MDTCKACGKPAVFRRVTPAQDGAHEDEIEAFCGPHGAFAMVNTQWLTVDGALVPFQAAALWHPRPST